jgi:tetratricopeptide (TPR) repeat protein
MVDWPRRVFTRALRLFALGSAIRLGAAECENQLGEAQRFFHAQNFSAAAAAFEKALPLCPTRVPVLISLAQVQYLLGDDAASERNLKAAIDADPEDTQAHYALGRIYYQQHRDPAAETEFREVIRREPKNYRAWDNLALTLDAQHRDDEAIKAFLRTLDLVKTDHPDYDWAYANFADFFLRRNEFEKAFQLAAEAAQRNPQSARNAFLTGNALVKLGHEDKSERWLKRALELDPGYSEARYVLARVYRKLGRTEEAERQLEEFRKARQKPRSRR